MADLAEREQALVAALATALPGHHVRASLLDAAEVRRVGVLRLPSVLVGAVAWEDGATTWRIQVIHAEMRSPDDRRNALHAAVTTVRNALSGMVLSPGHGPLVARGGRLLAAIEPHAAWEERFGEAAPSHAAAQAFLIRRVRASGSLAASVDAGATTLAATLSPVPDTGTPLVLEGGGLVRLAGRVVTIAGGVVSLDRAVPAPFPQGTVVHAAIEHLALAAPEMFPREVRHHAAATTAYSLAGEPIRLLRGVPRTETFLRHGPMTRDDADAFAEALRAWNATPALLHADPAGMVRRVVAGDPVVAREINGRLAVLELPVTVLATLALAAFAEEG